MALNGPSYSAKLIERDSFFTQMQDMHIGLQEGGGMMSPEELDGNKDMLNSYWKKYLDAHTDLVAVVRNLGIDDSILEQGKLATKLYGEVSALLKHLRGPTDLTTRLSDIKLDKFSGSYTHWTTWRAQFTARVKDTKLKVTNKIELLMGALEGEAKLNVGAAFHYDESEFKRLWDQLTKTYDNKYQQIMAHIGAMFSIPKMQSQSAEDLRFVIDTVNENCRHLIRFEIGVEQWKPVLFYNVIQVLDNDTKDQWDVKEKEYDIPSLDELFKFLEGKILAIRNATSDKALKSGGRERNITVGPIRTPVTSNRSVPYQAPMPKALIKRECICCGRHGHGLDYCTDFKRLSLADRHQLLKDKRACFTCLRVGHNSSACYSKDRKCFKCNLHHHELLCRNSNGVPAPTQSPANAAA